MYACIESAGIIPSRKVVNFLVQLRVVHIDFSVDGLVTDPIVSEAFGEFGQALPALEQ